MMFRNLAFLAIIMLSCPLNCADSDSEVPEQDIGTSVLRRKDNYTESLIVAIGQKNTAAAQSYIALGANLNASSSKTKVTPLTKAATIGDLPSTMLLLSVNHNIIDALDGNGVNALMCAAAHGHLALVQILLFNGANKNVRSSPGKNTALHYAARFNRAAVARILLANGIDADARNLADEFADDLAQGDAVNSVLRPINNFFSRMFCCGGRHAPQAPAIVKG